MARQYLKKALKTSQTDNNDVRATVQGILDDIETRGDSAAREYYFNRVRIALARANIILKYFDSSINSLVGLLYENYRNYRHAGKYSRNFTHFARAC